MFRAEREQLNRVRAIQATQRDDHHNNRDWLLGNPLPVVDAPDETLEQEPEDNVIVDELEGEVAEQEIVLVPEEELEENPIGADNEDLILDFDLDDNQEEAPMDQLNLVNVIQGLQADMDALRNEHTRIGMIIPRM
ncbi:MAG: hypothetical protein GY861_00035 [bacterium]|nr:hypothetical protein [bacterium]